jgi:hypothetical protein
MKIVSSNLAGDLSLVDKVWNDAMETAALHCEDVDRVLCAANGDSDGWVWPAARMFRETAAEFRKQKRSK